MRAGEGAARRTAAGSGSQLEEQRKMNKRGKNTIKVIPVLSNHNSILTFLVVPLNTFVPQ